IVTALVGGVDGAKARADGEFCEGSGAVFFPGSAVEEIGRGLRRHRAIVTCVATHLIKRATISSLNPLAYASGREEKMMKKIFSLLFVSLLLIIAAAPALGEGD